MPTAEQIAVIFNPAANKGRAARVQTDLLLLLRAAGLRPELFITSQAGEAVALARDLAQAQRHAAVIAAGGDGTINEVLNGLFGTSMPLGLLPVGTGNDFVKMFDLASLPMAVERIAQGTLRTIDVGLVNGRAFLNGIGIGIDAQIAIEAHKIKRLSGLAVYVAALLRTVRSFRPPELQLTFDDQILTGRWSMVTIGNGGCHGGGFWVTPDAQVDDGRFDICTAEAMPTLRILRSFPRVIKGTHIGEPGITITHASNVIVEAPHGAPVHVDGEILGADVTRLEIEIRPAALQLRI